MLMPPIEGSSRLKKRYSLRLGQASDWGGIVDMAVMALELDPMGIRRIGVRLMSEGLWRRIIVEEWDNGIGMTG